ncbi:MAG: histidine phosphatase family protein [Candidatus Binataceae bacterium]
MALGPFLVAQQLSMTVGVRGVAVLTRHGETMWNRQGRVMGRNPVELSPQGRAQVEAVARFSRTIKPDLIVTSPLVRARQSAEIISASLGGIEMVEEPDIAEVMYGRWEGKTYHDLIKDPEYLSYRKAPLERATPGGETIGEVQQRGVGAITRIIAANPERLVLFVSHGDIIRTVLCHFMSLELKHFHRIRIDNATLSAIRLAGSFAEIKFVNLLPDPERAFIPPFSTEKPADPQKP